ncbi:MAG: 50S ribosomal protein L4, partial [Planctomycetota bacterium]
VKSRKVDPALFGRRTHRVLLKEAVIQAEARRRAGTHATRRRSEIRGTTAKLYRQKHTGHARHGSRKAPIFRGGGICHGPKPRSYGTPLSTRARRIALRSALRAKLEAGDVRMVEAFAFRRPRTRDFAELLSRLDVGGSFLVVCAEHADAVRRSCRNLPGSGYRVVADLNAYEVLRQGTLIFDQAAWKRLEERFGDG